MGAIQIRQFSFSLVLLFFVGIDVAAAKENCFKYESKVLGRKINYCMERTRPELPVQPGEPVAYYFHGIFADHKAFYSNGYDQTLKKAAEYDLPPMTFVSFQTESLSYYIDIDHGGRAYETWFLTEFMPYIESTYDLCRIRECRGLVGNSMGGMGTFHLGFNNPELFAYIANTAPVMVPYNVFDDMKIWDDYFDRHPISRLKGHFLIHNARDAFKGRDNFDRHSIITIARDRVLNPEILPKLFFDVGGKDGYGFYEGFAILKELFDRQGVTYQSAFYPESEHSISNEPIRRERVLRFISDYFHGRL